MQLPPIPQKAYHLHFSTIITLCRFLIVGGGAKNKSKHRIFRCLDLFFFGAFPGRFRPPPPFITRIVRGPTLSRPNLRLRMVRVAA